MNKYSVYIEWGVHPEKGPYESCFIAPTSEEDYEHDGDNYVSKGGSEGMKFFICDGLEEAIRKAQFNPREITFLGLSGSELILKDNILKNRYFGNDTENGVPQF